MWQISTLWCLFHIFDCFAESWLILTASIARDIVYKHSNARRYDRVCAETNGSAGAHEITEPTKIPDSTISRINAECVISVEDNNKQKNKIFHASINIPENSWTHYSWEGHWPRWLMTCQTVNAATAQGPIPGSLAVKVTTLKHEFSETMHWQNMNFQQNVSDIVFNYSTRPGTH